MEQLTLITAALTMGQVCGGHYSAMAAAQHCNLFWYEAPDLRIDLLWLFFCPGGQRLVMFALDPK